MPLHSVCNAFLAVVACIFAGALGFRIRGGYLGDRFAWWRARGQMSRLAYGAVMAAAMLGAGWPWPVGGWRLALLGLALMGAWFAGAAAFGTFSAVDAGRNADPGDGAFPRIVDFLGNGLRGLLHAAPAAAVFAGFRWAFGGPDAAWPALALPLCGLLQGGSYELAWRVRRMEPRPTELAEWLTGAALGLGAGLACVL